MANLLGVGENTLHRHLKTDELYQEAITRADSKATRYLVSKMYEEAIGGKPYKKVTVKQTSKGVEITTIMGTTMPKPNLMMFWATNRDNEHWKHVKQVVQDITENKKHTYELLNGDKVAQLAGAILGSDSDGAKAKPVVSTVAPSEAGRGRGSAEDVLIAVCGQAADSVQDTPVDLPAEAGTEPV